LIIVQLLTFKEGQHSSDKEGSDKNNLGENTTSASTNKMKTKVVYVGIYGSIDRIGTNREGGRENHRFLLALSQW